MKTKKTSVVILGSGNVATQLAKALRKAGCKISGIWSRNKKNADLLSKSVNSKTYNKLSEIDRDADFYILSVNDDSISELAKKLPELNGIVLHTSGSIPLAVLSKHHTKTAVLYPLQSIQKENKINFKKIPVLVEGNDDTTARKTKSLARLISKEVVQADSNIRKRIHLAAVIANNFTNHLIAISDDILQKNHLPADLLIPLIKETVRKAAGGKAKQAQTGPALRNDQTVMAEHLKMLSDQPEVRLIYKTISESIQKKHTSKNKNAKK